MDNKFDSLLPCPFEQERIHPNQLFAWVFQNSWELGIFAQTDFNRDISIFDEFFVKEL